MAQLITIGEILVEIMAEKTGQTFTQAGYFQGPFASGAPAIMIDQAARAGASCAIIACVGNDDFGKLNIKRLKADGVDTSGIVIKTDETTGVAFVGYAEDGSRSFIFHFAHAAAGALKADEIRSGLFDDVRIFHIMGCSLSASESLRDAVLAGAMLAKERGALLSFDPNIRPELLKDKGVHKVFSWTLENCDILLTGKKELEQIMDMEWDRALKACREMNKFALVIKDGSRGTRIITKDIDSVMPAYCVTEVDPTGAGDCFDGAFLASFLAGKSLKESARIGNAAGALSVTKKGPMEGAAFMRDIRKLMGE